MSWNRCRITAVLKVEKDIIASIVASLTGRAVILVIMYVEILILSVVFYGYYAFLHRPATSHWQIYHIILYWVHLAMSVIRTHNYKLYKSDKQLRQVSNTCQFQTKIGGPRSFERIWYVNKHKINLKEHIYLILLI